METLVSMTNCGKLLQRWEYQAILPVSWETCIRVKKQELEPCRNNWLVQDRERSTTRLSAFSCSFNLYPEHIMRNARLDELQAGIKIDGKNINNLRYVDDPILMAASEEELKSLLMRLRE